jgi:hypothetical protein
MIGLFFGAKVAPKNSLLFSVVHKKLLLAPDENLAIRLAEPRRPVLRAERALGSLHS